MLSTYVAQSSSKSFCIAPVRLACSLGMASSSDLHLPLSRKRFRDDSQDNCSESPSFHPDDLSLKRLNASSRQTSSISSQSSCVSVCDALFTQQHPLPSCPEPAATSESVVAFEGGSECAVEEADSSSGSGLASHEGESKDSTSIEDFGLDYTFTPCTYREEHLRRTASEAAESCSGEDAQVDIDCFLKDWDEDVDGFNPAEVFKNKLYTNSEEYFDAAFAPDSDALGVSVAAVDNEDWFLSELGCDGQIYWNEAQDQEWMATAVANLDRINDAFASDASMLQLLEAGPGM